MSDIVGLALAGRTGRRGRPPRRGSARRHVIAAFSVPADDDAAAAIRGQLAEAGVRARRAHVGLPRRAVVAKAVELPPVPGSDLRRMVGFELERHLPFPPSEAVFDFEVLDAEAGRPVRVLLVAVERRSHERVRQLLRDVGLTSRLVTRGHPQPRPGREDDGRGRIVALARGDRRGAGGRRRTAGWSRAAPSPCPRTGRRGSRRWRAELARTLAALPEADRAEVAEVLVGGVHLPRLSDRRASGARSAPPRRPASRPLRTRACRPWPSRWSAPAGGRSWPTSCPTSFALARSRGPWPPPPRSPSLTVGIGLAIPARDLREGATCARGAREADRPARRPRSGEPSSSPPRWSAPAAR